MYSFFPIETYREPLGAPDSSPAILSACSLHPERVPGLHSGSPVETPAGRDRPLLPVHPGMTAPQTRRRCCPARAVEVGLLHADALPVDIELFGVGGDFDEGGRLQVALLGGSRARHAQDCRTCSARIQANCQLVRVIPRAIAVIPSSGGKQSWLTVAMTRLAMLSVNDSLHVHQFPFRSSPTLLPHLFFPGLWTVRPSCNTVLTRTPII